MHATVAAQKNVDAARAAQNLEKVGKSDRSKVAAKKAVTDTYTARDADLFAGR